MMNQEQQIPSDQPAEQMVNPMPASKMMTRSQYRASRSSAATQLDSKNTKAGDPLPDAAVNPELDQTDATDQHVDGASPKAESQEQLEAQKEQPEPTANDKAVTSTEAGGSSSGEQAASTSEEKPADVEGASEKAANLIEEEAKAAAQPVVSQPASKKRAYSEITGAAELAAEDEARRAGSQRGSKSVRLNDGTKKECPMSKSAATKGKVDLQA